MVFLASINFVGTSIFFCWSVKRWWPGTHGKIRRRFDRSSVCNSRTETHAVDAVASRYKSQMTHATRGHRPLRLHLIRRTYGCPSGFKTSAKCRSTKSPSAQYVGVSLNVTAATASPRARSLPTRQNILTRTIKSEQNAFVSHNISGTANCCTSLEVWYAPNSPWSRQIKLVPNLPISSGPCWKIYVILTILVQVMLHQGKTYSLIYNLLKVSSILQRNVKPELH